MTRFVKVIIPTGLGINSHAELGQRFKDAGADVDYMHLNDLLIDPDILDNYHGAGFPGGFTMGDQLGAGQSVANRTRESALLEKMREKIHDPRFPIYSVCNYAQVFAKLDLFPVPIGTVQNDSGKHETNMWDLEVNPDNDTIWLRHLEDYTGPIFAPISHGEGRFVVPSESLQQVIDQNLIALRYVSGHICNFHRSSRGDRYNPNGSTFDIAGFGWNNNLVLFPHFERIHHDFQRPDRDQVKELKGTTTRRYEPTALMFQAAVDFMKDLQLYETLRGK